MKTDLVGKRFGRLQVISRSNDRRGRAYVWKCRCDCGNEKNVATTELNCGKTKSCGCLRSEMSSQRRKTHGMSGSATYAVWCRMIRRCTNQEDKRWDSYGGRGICVCERWLSSFTNFFADMGVKPPDLSLDRIDNNGHYEPGNCRWATDQEQQNNKNNNTLLGAFGKKQTLAQWSREIGISHHRILNRLRRGWLLEAALATPFS